MPVPPPRFVTVSPEPTDDELAAILAAYGELWPAPVEDVAAAPVSRRWKFQGRWWVDGGGQRRPASGW